MTHAKEGKHTPDYTSHFGYGWGVTAATNGTPESLNPFFKKNTGHYAWRARYRSAIARTRGDAE
jgi:hypothetical protein